MATVAKLAAMRLVPLGPLAVVLSASASMGACFTSNGSPSSPDAGFSIDGTTMWDDAAPDAYQAPEGAAADATPDATSPDAGADAPTAPVDATVDSASDAPTVTPGDSAADAPADDALPAEEASVDAALAYPQVVIADAPLSYWRFGESSGTVAVDEMGATNGTYSATGVTLGAPGAIAGDSNTAATFDGMSGYVGMGAGFAFGGTAPMSYEAWLKPNVADPSARRFMSKETTDGNGREGFLMAYEQGGPAADGGAPANLLSWERWLDGAVDGVDAVVTPAVYQHVVVTYDGATMTIYLNGQAVGSVPSTRSISTLTDPFNVATYSFPGAPADCFGGTIDEVAIYDHALTAARVLLHYQVGSGN